VGKRSVKEKYLQQMKRYFAGKREKMKPPFRCPRCFREEAVHVKKQKIEKTIKTDNKGTEYVLEFRYRLFCQYRCFDTEIIYRTPIKTDLDAYCECCDQLELRKVRG